MLPYKQNLGRAGSGDSHARIRYGESTNFGRDLKKPVYFFLGANSEEGFFSLYDQLLGGRLDDLMILKGGPGCGKSSLMRKVGAAMEEQGLAVEYIQCSGDPDSLDAVIIPTLATAIVDGTAPHGCATQGHFSYKKTAHPGLGHAVSVWL